ncbi:MAG: MFS transporter [Bacteroidetes bacterium]|nr:MFS transporter [Bacteroidota bacterium]MBU1117067.1 MFS transporter [Bacteroidota bacterium]MBU1799075.1 MFS transporter [Bacteroidota bacterium]
MSSWKIKISLFLNYFIFAILLNTVGIVIAQVIDQYEISRITAGSLEAFKDLSIMVASFLVASYVPKIGYKRTMLIGLLIVTLGCILIASITSYWVTPLLYISVGASFALIKVSVYSTLGLITSNQKEHTSLMNTLEGIFMVGSLSGPIFFSLMINTSKWNHTYWILAVLSSLAFLLLLITDLDESKVHKKAEETGFFEMFRLLKHPIVIIFIIAAFLYVMIEQSLGTWLPTFNKEIFNLSAAQAASFLSIYAGSIALSRFLAGYLAKKISWFKLQLVYLTLAAIFILYVLLNSIDLKINPFEYWFQAPSLAFVLSFVGFFLGPIYPTICSIVLSKLEKIHHSSMTGLIIIFSALGGTTGSLIIGLISDNFNVHTAFYFPVIPIVLLILVLIPYKRTSDKLTLEEK